LLIDAVLKAGVERAVVVYPNNDPGSDGIVRQWNARSSDERLSIVADAKRDVFLGLMRDAAVIVGNSSSAIIEAASFRAPVVDVGPRQTGRERSKNTLHVQWSARAMQELIQSTWNGGKARRRLAGNVYGGDGAGRKIAAELANLKFDERYRRKLIAY